MLAKNWCGEESKGGCVVRWYVLLLLRVFGRVFFSPDTFDSIGGCVVFLVCSDKIFLF